MKKVLVTSALPYANGPLHLGHLAGAYLPADIYVRYLRLMGRDVVYVSGSDEHGAAITLRAKKEGTTPQAIIDKYHNLNKGTFEQLCISFDYYHRTSAPLHHETAQDFFLKLVEKGGQFEEKVSEQYYDEEFKQFLADRYIMGTCPKCGNEEAYGDQCESCGTTLSPTELINPKSKLGGGELTLRETKHWFFQLDKHADWLREWIKEGTVDGVKLHDSKDWKKHVIGQCLSWLDGEDGLRPRSITRDLDWGIKVPIEGADGKVLYVWFDAPIGYISATKQWAKENGKNWEDYWKGDDVELVHFIGKDNIVFHCIVFPAMLKAHGDYTLPVNVPANQFLNFEGQKFSKSRGWGIEQHEYLEEFKDFANKEDALRYVLIRNMPENKDADFKWDEFVDFYDKELADNLGNFINRVIVLTHKYLGGKVPTYSGDLSEKMSEVTALVDSLTNNITAYQFKQAIHNLMEISSWGNTYLQDVSPWKIFKAEPESEVIKECMFICLQVVGILSVLTEPFVPNTSKNIRGLLNLEAVQNGDLRTLIENLKAGKAIVSEGHEVGEAAILFAKINDRKDKSRLEIIDRQKAKLEAVLKAEKAKQRAPIKETITFEDFTKLDIRSGTILTAEPIKKANKLLKLTVDIGLEIRTVVSGIAQQYKPEDVVGKKVALVVNLAPRTMRGVESQGMVLMVEDCEGKLAFVASDKDLGNGQMVK
ncbi:MAG: methionyl-tRNA synthetase [Paraglaciecola sp.]|jgi:methionyl-tRNA synthetase